MRTLAAAFVTVTILAADFLGDAGIVTLSEKAQKGWDMTATLALIVFVVVLFLPHDEKET